jgi:hypothetical protein
VNFQETTLDELDEPNALEAMYRGGDALVIHDCFDPKELAKLTEALTSSHADRYHWDLQEEANRPEVTQMRVLGRTLTPIEGHDFDLDAYARIGEETAACINRYLPGLFSQLEAILGRLSGGRPVMRARANGRDYGPATVRHLPVGCQIPVHCGLFFMESGGYREIMKSLDEMSQLSWFIPLQTASAGGELLVYDLQWTDPDVPKTGQLYDPTAIESRPAVAVNPPAGSLLLFDGGRWFHKVSPVEGTQDRWTLGGFLGFKRDMLQIVYWS